MSRLRVGLIDHGAGNQLSVRWALEDLGAAVQACRGPADLAGCAAIVVPGVGASAPAMARLRRSGLDRAIGEAVAGGTWYLGVCLGLQLLFERSDEDGAHLLGLLPGTVRAIPDAPRLPHIGWNQVVERHPHPLVAALGPGRATAYFVHSYAVVPRDPAVTMAETQHGGWFPSIVAARRIVGTQFHPERSGPGGRRLLAAFLALAGDWRPRAA